MDGSVLARTLRWQIVRLGVVGNITAAVVVFGVTTFVATTEDYSAAERQLESTLLFVAYGLVSFPAVAVGFVRVSRPFLTALAAGERLDGPARAALLAHPWRVSVLSMAGWGGAAVVFPLHNWLRVGLPWWLALGTGLVILLGGVTTLALVYLLDERALRPVFAQAFADGPPEEASGVGVRARLVLTWVLGAAIPMILAAVPLADADADADSLRREVAVWLSVGVAVGWAITLRAARSVAEPVEGVRQAMDRLHAGDLEVSVPVDDATEVGLLQAGFNRMVHGLREREQLHDLFGRHVGEDVARQALERGVQLGGEEREASALFVDLVGSTGLATRHAPSEVVEMLNAFFAVVVDAAAGEGGWVNKFEGDAALCVFGVPVGEPDHAARALRAARRVVRGIDEVRARFPELDVGIGVSSGVVVAGNVGAEERYEYTVIGDPVNEAARLTDEAKHHPERVLASAATVAAAGEAGGVWRQAAVYELRGRDRPTEAFVPAE